MKNKIVFLLILICVLNSYIFADEPKPVVLSPVNEAWLGQDLKESYRILEIELDKKPAEFVILYNLGYIAYLQGNYVAALGWLNKSALVNPAYPYTYLTLGKIHEGMNKTKHAISMYQRGLLDSPGNYDLSIALAKVLIKAGKTSQAEKILLNLLNDHGDKTVVRTLLARIMRKQKRLGEAKLILDSKKQFFPDSDFLIEKARYFEAIQKPDKAKSVLTGLMLDYPNSARLAPYLDTLAVKYHSDSVAVISSNVKYNYRIYPNERQDYEVTYGFITLGWLKIRVTEKLEINGRNAYRVIFYVNSNPKYAFLVELNHIYESFIDTETLAAVKSRLYTPGDPYLVRTYYFEYDKNLFKTYNIADDGRFEYRQKDLPTSAQDGTSILYYTRGLLSNKTGGTTPVVINEEYKLADINYLNQTESMEYKGKNVDAIKIYAKANFSGIAGMTGDAWGWFSPDKDLVPIVGKLKIFLGSIAIEHIK